MSKPTHASHEEARPLSLSLLIFGSFITTPFFRQLLTDLLGDNLSCLARAALGGELLLKPSTRTFCHFQLLIRLFQLVPGDIARGPLCGNLKADLRELFA